MLNVDRQFLNLATFNVRGFKNNFKQSSVLKSFIDEKIDILALQETHLKAKDYIKLSKKWPGPILFSEGSNHSLGLCILFDKNFKSEETKLIFNNDRVLLCSFKIGQENFYICNIYSPNENKKKRIFFENINNIIKNHLTINEIQKLILLGDFNCVLDNNFDIISGEQHSKETVQKFNNLVNDLDLIDLWRHNNPSLKEYTWSGKKPLVSRRLDYILANKHILPNIFNCEIKSHCQSDHRLVICYFEFFKFKRGNGIYKINSTLFKNVNFKDTMSKYIKDNLVIFSELNPVLKWNTLKNLITEFTQQFGKLNKINKTNNEKKLYEKLNCLENYLVNDSQNLKLQEDIIKCKTELELINIEKTEAAKLRSKIKWVEEGEKCSKYFLSLERSRGKSSTVFKVQNKNGLSVYNETEIVKVFAEHFEQVYKNTVVTENIETPMNKFLEKVELKKLSDDDKIFLDEPITLKEIENAFKNLNKDSSPGYDGLTMDFYELFFENIKETLFEYYNFCFDQNSLSESTQIGLISLIHKGKGLSREEVGNWRPITLSNIDYKILAKLLANRLKKVVSSIVGTQQQGFIKGRNIANIIRGIDDIMDYVRSNNLKEILFIIDFKQAFDKINNSYITAVFKKFGFGDNFIKWLEILLKNRKSCVKNGGHISRLFEVTCGVKQGCAIAPLLYVIASEILAQNIIQDEIIKGVSYPGSNQEIKINQFADDTSFFCGSIIDIREILSRLKLFEGFSGLSINKKKCCMIYMGKKENDEGGLEEIKPVDKAKIVGIVFSNKKSASELEENWVSKIEKIKSIVKSWMKRNLTYIGKILVVKTFLLSQLVYIMQGIVLPTKILDEINVIFHRFIWKKDNIQNRANERIKRTVLSNHKNKGGLGMINIHNFQKSFLINWGCRVLSENNLEWTIIPKFFLKELGGSNVFNSKTNIKDFKGLEKVENVFWKNVVQTWIENNIYDKKITKNDPINNNCMITLNNNIIFNEKLIKNGVLTINDMLSDDRIITMREFENKVGPDTNNLMDYVTVKAAISKAMNLLQLSVAAENKFKKIQITKLNRKKIFELLKQEETCQCETFWERKLNKKLHVDIWKNIFKDTKEIKLQELQWKIVHNIFPTNIILNRMHIKETENCDFCGEKEFTEHLFFNCKRVEWFWKEISTLLSLKLKKKIRLTEYSVLLGIELDDNSDNLTQTQRRYINEIIMIGKLAIIKSKALKCDLKITFEKESRIRNINFLDV